MAASMLSVSESKELEPVRSSTDSMGGTCSNGIYAEDLPNMPAAMKGILDVD